jgi:hypothetical protein
MAISRGFIWKRFIPLSGKPILVGEFYMCARDNRSGNKNSRGVYPLVATQKERAADSAPLSTLCYKLHTLSALTGFNTPISQPTVVTTARISTSVWSTSTTVLMNR